ncbi:alpha/beta hydrolase [Pengzhenrongella sp.]|jgi:enterochelin esterase-like enzyme|uniref:alpha/beta hydrolase n=1 Tax=Pengzhenrongella sp. TaxID=2888820 RepID=UPI002F9379F0
MLEPRPQTASILPHAVLAELRIGADWLGTWWPPAVLAALGVVLVVVAARRGANRSRGRGERAVRAAGPLGIRRRWHVVVGAVLTLLVASGFAVNTYASYIPSVSAAWWLLTGDHQRSISGTPAGIVTGRTVPAPPALDIPQSTTWIYTPPGYDPAGTVRYPVVYLVHGTPGESANWFTGGNVAHVMDVLIAHHLVRPMIVVAPDVNGREQDDTECLNSDRGGSQVETYLDDVVVPWVDRHYPTRADWRHRVIGGMSAGGFCAIDQGLRHQELFGAIIALEPYNNPGSGGRTMLRTQAQFDARSPGRYLPTMRFAHPVPTFLDIGQEARGGDGSETATLTAQLRARGQDVLFRDEPNLHHNWTMARTGIPYGLVFVSAHFPQ